MEENHLLEHQPVTVTPADDSTALPPQSIGRGWQVVIAIAGLVIIGVLVYPMFQSAPTTPALNPTAAVPAATLSPAEATAQANPDSAEAQFNLGNAYVKTGQWPQAAAAYKKAIELNPNYQTAYANLGVVYYQQGQFDLAASQYQKALELNPDDIDVAYNLGALYLQQAVSAGDTPDEKLLNQAVTYLETINQKAPHLAEPYFSLGVAYTILNRQAEAITAFQAFLNLDAGQDDRARQEAQRYLDNLRGQ